ncbi:MAG: nucleoside monophosphate kinase [Candidatus Staskawiczbacteria bacterium]|jgi:adenylate kinase
MNRQVIILFGPPGAGKGTQAELLADKLGFHHFESSKVLEAFYKKENPEKVIEADGEKFKIADEIKRWKTGLLNSPKFVVELFSQRIKDLADEGESIVFSGSPRTVYEAEKEIPLFIKLYGLKNIKLVMLELTPETTIFRNSHRKICELIRHSILFNEETEKLTKCPLDGSVLVARKGLDDVETIKKRLQVFHDETLPVLKVAEKLGLRVNKIDGEQSVADVYKDVLSAIK